MHHFLLHWLSTLGNYSYLIVFLLVFAESGLLLLLPGETVVLVAGVLASKHILSLPLVIAVASSAAVAGDACGYFLGHGPARERFLSRGRLLMLRAADIDRVKTFLGRYGPWAVISSRFISLLRVATPFVCGLTDYPLVRFFPFNIPAGIVWGASMALLGDFGGRAWERAHRWIGHASLALGAVLLVFVLIYIWRRRTKRVVLTPENSDVTIPGDSLKPISKAKQ